VKLGIGEFDKRFEFYEVQMSEAQMSRGASVRGASVRGTKGKAQMSHNPNYNTEVLLFSSCHTLTLSLLKYVFTSGLEAD
jgi:hypothetical protein